MLHLTDVQKGILHAACFEDLAGQMADLARWLQYSPQGTLSFHDNYQIDWDLLLTDFKDTTAAIQDTETRCEELIGKLLDVLAAEDFEDD